jgi:hypothetical protein
MTRFGRLALAIAVPFALATTAGAQTPRRAAEGLETPTYNLSPQVGMGFGGFGFEYAQPQLAGSVIMDQWGFWHATPTVEPTEAPAAVAVRNPSQQRTRGSRSNSEQPLARPRYQLPTGTLRGSGGESVILYTPESRYRAYGNGYSRGPYGVTDYSRMYRGAPLD